MAATRKGKKPAELAPIIVASDNKDGLMGILTAVLSQTQVIQTADTATDDKSNDLMAASLVVIALLATQLKNELGEWQLLVIASMAVMIIVVGLALLITRGRKYYGTVVDLQQYKEYFAMDNELLLIQLIEDAQSANRHNRDNILKPKQRLFSWALTIFLFGFALGVLSLFISA